MNFYVPIIKTGEAELRGLKPLSEDVKDKVTPLFELTRSRKTKNNSEGPIQKKLERIKEIWGADREFILDLTGEASLSNLEIRGLQNSQNGYFSWCEFMKEQQSSFPKIYPVIQISEDENLSFEENKNNLIKQISSLSEVFSTIVYRAPITDSYYLEDLSTIFNNVKEGTKVLYVIDGEFIERGGHQTFATEIVKKIKEVSSPFPKCIFLPTATSFPRSVSEYSKEDYAEIYKEEEKMYKEIVEEINSDEIDIHFGDYATINPNRNDIRASGWIPRIDVPLKDKIFYYRERKEQRDYATVYPRVANSVIEDNKFKELAKNINCWGIEQIIKTANGKPTGLSPSFWISVRLNIHISLKTQI